VAARGGASAWEISSDFRRRTGSGLSAAHICQGTARRDVSSGYCAPDSFAVTSELAPPDSADPEDVHRRARIFDGHVDAINANRRQWRQLPHVESGGVRAPHPMGYAPVMQISCRDKNRIAIQGDILGGAAMSLQPAVPDRAMACRRATIRRPCRCLIWIR